MVTAQAKIRITTKASDIQRLIKDAIYRKMNRVALEAQTEALRYMKTMTKKQILQSDTYLSLITNNHNSLKAHFGLPDPERRLNVIINTFVESFYISNRRGFFSGVRGGNKSGFTMNFMPMGGWSTLTSLNVSNLTTEKGDVLPWLEWLLLRGNARDLVVGYEIEATSDGRYKRWRSRTGLAVMVKRTEGKYGGRWGVPLAFTGTSRDNFLTKAVIDVLTQHKNTIIYIIKTSIINGFR